MPAGDVVSQTTAPGTSVPVGATVGYQVSLGVETVAVPDLAGALGRRGREALTEPAWSAPRAEAYSADVPAGDVVSQTTAPGTSVPVGAPSPTSSAWASPRLSSFRTCVSYRRRMPPPPSKPAGLDVGETVEKTSESVAAGDVIKTDPPADTELALGAPVDLYVSSGHAAFTLVPEVKGLAEADANAAIAAAGLVVAATEQKTNATIPAGQAVKTEPAAGSEVQTGSAVTLTVSKGPKQVSVPAIVGLLQPDAKAAIEAAELSVGTSSVVEDASPKNTVLAQDPPPDTSSPRAAP